MSALSRPPRRLHWLPYELTRCRELRGSTVSTRALYGNFKFRPPFPRLPAPPEDYVPGPHRGGLELAQPPPY